MARRRWVIAGVVVLALAALAVPVYLAARGDPQLAQVREATSQYQDLDAALAAGYGALHTCTDDEGGAGAMGQHYAHGELVGDTVFDLDRPEVLVYEPLDGGGERLVAVEFVTFAEPWDAQSDSPPTLFGRELALVPEPNRYGVPAFYQIHVWLWKNNPAGMFNDWNTEVSCRGAGDPE